MSNMIVFKPLIPTAVTTESIGTGSSNLLTSDPKEVWVSGSSADQTIHLDMGASVTVDTFMVGFHNQTAAMGFVLGTETSLGVGFSALDTITAVARASGAPRGHALMKRSATATGRYWGFRIGSLGSVPQVGIVAMGLSFQPTFNREWGSGRQIIDTGVKEPLLGGGFGIGEGARKAAYRWTFGDLSDTEVQTLFNLGIDQGETRPIVAVEDPDNTAGLSERVHYGLFDRFEAYERQNPSQTRWALSMTEWT